MPLARGEGCPCSWVGAQLKKVLSGNTEATIFVESLQNDVDASGAISRDAFEALCEPLVNRIVKPMQQVGEPPWRLCPAAFPKAFRVAGCAVVYPTDVCDS